MGGQPCWKPATCTAQTPKKRGQTSMPRVGVELTILMFEQAETFLALYHVTTDLRGCFKMDKYSVFQDTAKNIDIIAFILFDFIDLI
jgi:hypothetical protein